MGWGDNVPVLLREVPVRAASPWDLCVPTRRCSGTSAARRVRWRGHVPARLESRHFVLGTGNTLPAGRAFYLLADGEESPLSLDVLRRDSDIPDSAPVRPCCSGAVMSGEVALAAARCPQGSSAAPAALERRLAGSAEALGLSAGALGVSPQPDPSCGSSAFLPFPSPLPPAAPAVPGCAGARCCRLGVPGAVTRLLLSPRCVSRCRKRFARSK